MGGKSWEGRQGNRVAGGGVREGCGDSHGILVGPPGWYVVANILDLVVRFTSLSCKMRAFPILPPSYLFFVLQKSMRSPLMGPNRGMSVGMTALANDNVTNFTRNDPNQTTHTRNAKRRLRLSAWLTLLVLQVQVQVQLRRARQSTPRNHEPRRNVVCTATHHCTMARGTWFLSFTVNPCLQQQWSKGRRTRREDAVRRSHAPRVHPRRQDA